ncbi:MAG: PIN domain-containing protein [Roseiflexaceae bacterium]
MRTNYILIDYENIQPATIDLVNYEHVRLFLFLGANQTKITVDLALAMQKMGIRAQYVRIAHTGPNALDFHIAYSIGQITERDTQAYIHIVSKDTGFDPLVAHLRAKKIAIQRVEDLAEIAFVKLAQVIGPSERFLMVTQHLGQMHTNKPRTVATLTNTINTLFQKTLSDAEVAALVKELQKYGKISVNDTKVTYLAELNGKH